MVGTGRIKTGVSILRRKTAAFMVSINSERQTSPGETTRHQETRGKGSVEKVIHIPVMSVIT